MGLFNSSRNLADSHGLAGSFGCIEQFLLSLYILVADFWSLSNSEVAWDTLVQDFVTDWGYLWQALNLISFLNIFSAKVCRKGKKSGLILNISKTVLRSKC